MSITLSALQKQRRDTAANWTSANPTLLAGEIGIESDTGYWKVGDGSTVWNSLVYLSGLGGEIPVSRLADGSARQLLQTAANGNDVEWTSNVDIPGTLDVTGAATFDAAVTITGNLTVNGTTTNINTQNLVVEDKNIIIGDVATPTDITADGGGITLKGTTDKTISWIDATDAWTFSEHISIASAKEYRINGTKVLDATSLGSAVVSSSLTSVGTIATGTWSATTIAVNKGGTGQTSYTDGQLLIGNSTGNTLTKSTLTAGSGVTITNGNGSISISATGSGGTVTSVSGTAPISVATGTTTPAISIADGSTTVKGAVQLTDSTSSTSTTTAATPNSVKSAYDLANAALPKAGGTLTGDVTLNAQSDLRFADADSSNWVAFQAPTTVASNVTWTLPATDAAVAGNALVSNASGVLSWGTINSGTVTSVSGTAPISVATGTTTPAISIADGSTTVKGAVQLTDSTSSTSTTTAATPNSVKSAYDLANGKASLGTAQTFTAAQRGTVSAQGAVTGTVTLDLAVANNFSMTLPAGGTLTLANPSNQTAGQSGAITITQNATTAATVAYGGNWKFSGGTPTMSTGLSSVSVLVYFVESSSRITAQLLTSVA
jgi:hypothetical protein